MNEGITGRATTPVGAAHPEMKTSGKLESWKRSGEPQIQELQVGRPLPWALSFGVHRTVRPTSFVSDSGARWAGKMDDLEAFEADFAAPFFEIDRRIIERVAEFDQHV